MKDRKIGKLMVAMLLSVTCLAGCKSNGGANNNSSDPIYIDNGQGTKEDLPYQIVSDKYFVKSGATDYVIVIPENSDDILKTASQELRNFFNEATGIRPAVYTDVDELPNDVQIISLGQTKPFSERIEGGEIPVSGGYRMVTDEEDLFIKGGDSYGTLWGVYDLLGYMFDYEFYKKDVYEIDHNVTELNFFTIDETVAPNIPIRAGYSALSEYNSSITSLRYRLQSERTITAGEFHNSFIVLDPAKYNNVEDSENYHPMWYTASVDQLCYTARGDENEYEEMIDTASEYFVGLLEAQPSKTHVFFQMQDTRTWCECTACKEAETKYQARSAAMLIACHDIHEKIMAKLSEKGDDRYIKVVPFLYHSTESLPVVLDSETGEYKLSDPSLDFSGVAPMWANLSTKKHASAYQDEDNKAALIMLDKLNVAFDDFWVWDYGINFADYLLPFNVFSIMSEDFSLLEDYNVGFHMYQCDHSAFNSTGFGALKLYLISELAWNANQDIEELTDNFFNAVYGDGAKAMKKIYDEYRVLAAYNSVDHGETLAWSQTVYSETMLSKTYFPKGVVKAWLQDLDSALQSIEYLKTTNPLQYEIYEKNISADGIFARYIYARLYMESDTDENVNFKINLYRDVERLNFHEIREGSGIWNLAVSLGIASYLG